LVFNIEVTQCNFSSLGDVHRYIENSSVTNCKIIAEKVAIQAERIIEQKDRIIKVNRKKLG